MKTTFAFVQIRFLLVIMAYVSNKRVSPCLNQTINARAINRIITVLTVQDIYNYLQVVNDLMIYIEHD